MSFSEILAIDVGERRIGVARANVVARLPEPLKVVDRQQFDSIEKIAAQLMGYRPDAIVVGIPRNLSGQNTAQTEAILSFFAALESIVAIPLIEQDESLSTVESQKWRVRFPEASEDSLAACVILDRYLDRTAL